MHHRIHTTAQALHQRRIAQVTRNQLGTTGQQRLHRLGAACTNAHLQALFQGKAGEAPTNKTTRTGYQNLHQSPCPTSAIVPRTLAAPAQPAR